MGHSHSPKGSMALNDRLQHDAGFQLIRLDLRKRLEAQPMPTDTSLAAALKKLPGKWTSAICDAMGLEASSRDVERKTEIARHLARDSSMRRIWSDLPEPSRKMLHWLVVERGGWAAVRDLYEEFGDDDDCSYFWNQGELPTTALGLLRLYCLVFKGWTGSRWGRIKVAVVPVDLRDRIKGAALVGRGEPAPPMPAPAFRKTIGRPETLEARGLRAGGRKFERVYQFMITLKDVRPVVWRRIQVPEDYSFWDLHVAIQDAMGWLDCHMHVFRIAKAPGGPEVAIGLPDEEFGDGGVRRGFAEYISNYFSMDNPDAEYLYDFGDDWLHRVRLEAALPARDGVTYPVCLAGERACPPEDCGGPPGFEEFLRIVGDPLDEEHEEMLAWAGGPYDPERFDPAAVRFDDPYLRWRGAFLGDEEARAGLASAGEGNTIPAPSGELATSLDAVTHTNRRGDVYYLHPGKTTTGKTCYRFSRKADGVLAREIPPGFEAHELPDGRVYLRRIPERIITEAEEQTVRAALERAGVPDCIVEVKRETITVFLPDIDPEAFSELFDARAALLDLIARAEAAGLSVPESVRLVFDEALSGAPDPRQEAAGALKRVQSYTPLLRFVLEDAARRTFTAERPDFSGAADEWMPLESPQDLQKIAGKYCRRLAADPFLGE